jgi:hypothetical protein
MCPLPSNTNINKPALMCVLGMPSCVNKEEGTYNLDAQVYMHALGEKGWLSLAATMSPLCYGKVQKKPMPRNTAAFIKGFTDSATFDDKNKLERLGVVVNCVAFPNQCWLPVTVSCGT